MIESTSSQEKASTPKRPRINTNLNSIVLLTALAISSVVVGCNDEESTKSQINVSEYSNPDTGESSNGQADIDAGSDTSGNDTNVDTGSDTGADDVAIDTAQDAEPDSPDMAGGGIVKVTVAAEPCQTADIDLCEGEGQGNQRIYEDFERLHTEVVQYTFCRPEEDPSSTELLKLYSVDLYVSTWIGEIDLTGMVFVGSPEVPSQVFELSARNEAISIEFSVSGGPLELGKGDCAVMEMVADPQRGAAAIEMSLYGFNGAEGQPVIDIDHGPYYGASPLTVFEEKKEAEFLITHISQFGGNDIHVSLEGLFDTAEEEIPKLYIGGYQFFASQTERIPVPSGIITVTGRPGVEVYMEYFSSNATLSEFTDFDELIGQMPESGELTFDLSTFPIGHELNNQGGFAFRPYIQTTEHEVGDIYTAKIIITTSDEYSLYSVHTARDHSLTSEEIEALSMTTTTITQ